MALTQMYVFEGIDLQVVLKDARKKSDGENNVLVHYHAQSRTCQAFKHAQFAKGVEISKWGDIDGSSTAPVR